MNIVFFSHPAFLTSQSMPRFANMLASGMKERGHSVEVLRPASCFFKLPLGRSLRKWMGYVDQYIVFPALIRKSLNVFGSDTIFVFTDQAQGPWVSQVTDRPHIIHCHDFLALSSSLGRIPENPTGWTGRHYQSFIRRGFSKGKCFVSVSRKTREDLHTYLNADPLVSEVVYNSLNPHFEPADNIAEVREELNETIGADLTKGYLLHVGANQWYKNRKGVIEIYEAWRSINEQNVLPMIMVGPEPSIKLRERHRKSSFKNDIHFLSSVSDQLLVKYYQGASLFLFPSLAEGFGWPIAEAMASGIPVITTNAAPMTEVAGGSAFLIERRPVQDSADRNWACTSAEIVSSVLALSYAKRKEIIQTGILNVKRFERGDTLSRIEKIYENILEKHGV